MIRIALDAMGGDHAPAAEVDGAALALRELDPDFTLVLVGRREAIEEHLARHPELDRSRLEIVDAPEVIGMGEKPLQAVRRKPDSSLVVGLGLHRDGHADAFVSAGVPDRRGTITDQLARVFDDERATRPTNGEPLDDDDR